MKKITKTFLMSVFASFAVVLAAGCQQAVPVAPVVTEDMSALLAKTDPVTSIDGYLKVSNGSEGLIVEVLNAMPFKDHVRVDVKEAGEQKDHCLSYEFPKGQSVGKFTYPFVEKGKIYKLTLWGFSDDYSLSTSTAAVYIKAEKGEKRFQFKKVKTIKYDKDGGVLGPAIVIPLQLDTVGVTDLHGRNSRFSVFAEIKEKGKTTGDVLYQGPVSWFGDLSVFDLDRSKVEGPNLYEKYKGKIVYVHYHVNYVDEATGLTFGGQIFDSEEMQYWILIQ